MFIQKRPGWHGRLFEVYKFRTMSEGRGEDGLLLPDEVRLTPLGRWLRQLSLDELPQLWNVIRGDMSLVGPRPLLVEYLARYSSREARRHEVRPGITGWAQVNGRNAVEWDVRLEMDVWYVEHCSLSFDMTILALTISKVLGREGIEPDGQVTPDRFVGSNGRTK